MALQGRRCRDGAAGTALQGRRCRPCRLKAETSRRKNNRFGPEGKNLPLRKGSFYTACVQVLPSKGTPTVRWFGLFYSSCANVAAQFTSPKVALSLWWDAVHGVSRKSVPCRDHFCPLSGEPKNSQQCEACNGWVANNWLRAETCFGPVSDAEKIKLSARATHAREVATRTFDAKLPVVSFVRVLWFSGVYGLAKPWYFPFTAAFCRKRLCDADAAAAATPPRLPGNQLTDRRVRFTQNASCVASLFESMGSATRYTSSASLA